MKILVVTLLLSLGVIQASEEDCHEEKTSSLTPVIKVAEATQSMPCSDPKKLRGLCMYVGNHDRDPRAEGRYRWKYQRKILEAACVDIKTDSEETIARKVAQVWNANEDILVCSGSTFDVSRGNIIKFAVNVKLDFFIDDVIRWGVNLNRIDPSDNRTVLDYIEHQIQRNKGMPLEEKLRGYYRILQNAGAKHKREL